MFYCVYLNPISYAASTSLCLTVLNHFRTGTQFPLAFLREHIVFQPRWQCSTRNTVFFSNLSLRFHFLWKPCSINPAAGSPVKILSPAHPAKIRFPNEDFAACAPCQDNRCCYTYMPAPLFFINGDKQTDTMNSGKIPLTNKLEKHIDNSGIMTSLQGFWCSADISSKPQILLSF